MQRTFLLLGSISAFVAITAGAFAAHGLRQHLPPEMLQVFETGARYQMYHALALLAVALLSAQRPTSAVEAAGWLFIIGTILFSGSLYVLALTGMRLFGIITPLGGLSFLAGWAALAVAAWQIEPEIQGK